MLRDVSNSLSKWRSPPLNDPAHQQHDKPAYAAHPWRPATQTLPRLQYFPKTRNEVFARATRV
jgi:hypothetical protein